MIIGEDGKESTNTIVLLHPYGKVDCNATVIQFYVESGKWICVDMGTEEIYSNESEFWDEKTINAIRKTEGLPEN